MIFHNFNTTSASSNFLLLEQYIIWFSKYYSLMSIQKVEMTISRDVDM